MRLLISLYSFH